MCWQLVTDWAQILTAVAAVTGVLLAAWNYQRTLHAAYKPHIRCILGNGCNPWFAFPFRGGFGDFSDDRDARQDPKNARRCLTLRNTGNGPARELESFWKIDGVNDGRVLPEDKICKCPIYPNDLRAGEKAHTWSLPLILVENYEREFTADLQFEVKYKDLFGRVHWAVLALKMRNTPKDSESSWVILELTDPSNATRSSGLWKSIARLLSELADYLARKARHEHRKSTCEIGTRKSEMAACGHLDGWSSWVVDRLYGPME